MAEQLTLKGGSIANWQISNALGAVFNNYSQAGIGYDTFILNSLTLTDASLSKRVHIQVQNIFGRKLLISIRLMSRHSIRKTR
jgi:hypothetical protein